eukprot:TRINITY_DN3331_c0_g2_i1.p1 TRINITY_DN3331_c0_g2~~TRINITY_DN3331_c0_g2_i1.p1  ORF type:complete len:503 (-),score=94.07 TRINITY_DN3331_c0_g2_i1:72-1502(-)
MGQGRSVQQVQGTGAARSYVHTGAMNTMGGTVGPGPHFVSGAPMSSMHYVQGGPGAGVVRPAAAAEPATPGSGGAGEAADLACMSACFEPSGAVASEDWQYMGPTKGSYEKVETYQYVGPGVGSVDKVNTVTYTGWKCRMGCIILCSILMLGIIGLLVWLLVRGQPVSAREEVTGTVAFDCNAGFWNWHRGWSYAKKEYCCRTSGKGCQQRDAEAKECVLWGDPHIRTFDESRLVFYSQGDFWLVKSSTISIQGRFQATDWTKNNDHTDYSSMTSIIVSGSFVGNHKIEVQSMLGKIYCDGQDILNQFGVSNCGGAQIFYDDKGSLVDQAMAFLQHRVVHLHLPGQVTMQVNRWPNFINAKIFMSKRDGQDGICGNFNGDGADDMGKDLHQRFGAGVPQSELLFAHPIPLVIPKALPSSKRCTEERRQRAEEICKKEEMSGGWSYAECLGDVCDAHAAGQPSFQAEEMRQQAQQTG